MLTVIAEDFEIVTESVHKTSAASPEQLHVRGLA
jgi:hypothetical protein